MTVELKPLGIACNLGCVYCYEHPMRDANNPNKPYNIEKMLEAADATSQSFSLFGGEILLVPKEDLEKFFQHGYEKWGKNGIQTNGVLIDDEHIEMFKKYNVHVGISIDGPDELNDLRWAGSLEKTREATRKTIENFEKLSKAGVGASVIITLHKMNTMDGRLEKLKEFILWLETLGYVYGNIHTLEVDSEIVRKKYVLSVEEEAEVLIDLAEFFWDHPSLRYIPFRDVPKLLLADDAETVCIWHHCDPLNTQSVHGIEGDGSVSNCGRVNKDGINWLKAETQGFERYLSLYSAPQDKGGCNGCRFWLVCGGSCTGEGMDGDWRNKTEHCYALKRLFKWYEDRLLLLGMTPISARNDRLEIEKLLFAKLANGENPTLSKLLSDYHAYRNNTDMRTIPIKPVQNIEKYNMNYMPHIDHYDSIE